MKLQKSGVLGMLAVVAIVVMMVVLFANPVGADTLKLGPKWVDGHSYDGEYGVNNKGDQSWGFGISYDFDGAMKVYSKHQAIGIDYGVMASYYHITTTVNDESAGGYLAHGKGDYKIRDVNSLVVGVYPKLWYELHGVRAYIAPIAGAEFADDGESAPMVGGMIGVEKLIYKNIGINLQHEELWTMKRRFDTTSMNLMFRF